MSASQKNSSKKNDEKKLLGRFLPPIPEYFASEWINSLSMGDSLVLDPFGAAPDLCIQAARNGFRLLVAANNPILRLLIEVAANFSTALQSKAALSTLAAMRVRDERIELHIQSLYKTKCPNCARDIPAEAFLWERDSKSPYARILHCQYCSTSGEYPLTAADLQQAAQFAPGGLHHARALERVAPLKDPDRIHVEEALNVYPPRAVYALLTLVNKLDLLNISTEESQILMVMMLSAFDQANTLWPHPVARERPRQLTIPPIYRENNIWMALEEAVHLVESEGQPISISYWPELPPENGGVCLFDGRIRDLVKQSGQIKFSAVMTAFPRPNQAFWSLSALWAGWLWGHQAVDHFKNVLRRRRYDWAWHCTATHAALQSLIPVLKDGSPINGMIGEAEPGYVSSVLISAEQAGFQLMRIGFSAENQLVKINWKIALKSMISSPVEYERTISIQSAAKDYLIARGEPSHFLQLHLAILSELGKQGLLSSEDTPGGNYYQIQQEIHSALRYQNGFLRFGGSDKSLDVGHWWLTDDHNASTPLSDRAERDVVNYLIRNPNCSFAELETTLINSVDDELDSHGLITPETALIRECLDSYGKYTGKGWVFRDQDTPSMRRQEIASILEMVTELGKKLKFNVKTAEEENARSIWCDSNDTPKYIFFISASAFLGKFFSLDKPASALGVIVLPGGRSNLVMFKLRRDPRFESALSQGWSFLKYRHARQLANNPLLTKNNLDSHLFHDPLTYSENQLRLF